MAEINGEGVPTLGLRLAQLMAEKGLNGAKLSAQARLSESYVSRIVRGQVTNPSIGSLLRLADSLGVSVGVLLSPPVITAVRASKDLPSLGDDTVGGQVEHLLAQAHLDEADEELAGRLIVEFSVKVIEALSSRQKRPYNNGVPR